MTHTGQVLFAALDFNTPLPLQTRIDAVGAACREVAGLHPSSAHAAQLTVTVIDALTHALLYSDEHLGEALMGLLEALLDKSSDPSELSRLAPLHPTHAPRPLHPHLAPPALPRQRFELTWTPADTPPFRTAGGCCSALSSRSSAMWAARPAWPGQPLPAGPVGRGRPDPRRSAEAPRPTLGAAPVML